MKRCGFAFFSLSPTVRLVIIAREHFVQHDVRFDDGLAPIAFLRAFDELRDVRPAGMFDFHVRLRFGNGLVAFSSSSFTCQ
jgi:hypothetical protein